MGRYDSSSTSSSSLKLDRRSNVKDLDRLLGRPDAPSSSARDLFAMLALPSLASRPSLRATWRRRSASKPKPYPTGSGSCASTSNALAKSQMRSSDNISSRNVEFDEAERLANMTPWDSHG